MSKEDIIGIIRQVLRSSDDIASDDKINFITNEIQAIVHEHRRKIADELQAKENVKQQKIQGRKEKKEQILRAQQRIKDEAERREKEKQQLATAATSYKDEKKQWYDLLGQVAQNKQATTHVNNALTQEALKKSQSLLSLADNIPTKNKAAISQKLKQKFSVALLEQQKNNDGPVNIYQTMDLFNNEVNKMTD